MKPRDNPFNSSRVEALDYRFASGTWEDLIERLDRLGGRGAIVGPKGSGKTTLMDQLADRLAEAGYTVRHARLNVQSRQDAAATVVELTDGLAERDAVLLDGAEQLTAWRWRRFVSRSGGAGIVVVTTHREGRLPTLLRTVTSAGLLRELVDRLLGPGHAVTDRDVCELFDRHGGDCRKALAELYDRWARREVGAVE